MSAESDVYDALSGAAAVTAIVSTRIYPDVLPQETAYPAVVFTRIGTTEMTTIHGTSLREFAVFQVSCLQTTRSLAETLANACAAALRAAGMLQQDRSASFDADMDLHVVALTYRHI